MSLLDVYRTFLSCLKRKNIDMPLDIRRYIFFKHMEFIQLRQGIPSMVVKLCNLRQFSVKVFNPKRKRISFEINAYDFKNNQRIPQLLDVSLTKPNVNHDISTDIYLFKRAKFTKTSRQVDSCSSRKQFVIRVDVFDSSDSSLIGSVTSTPIIIVSHSKQLSWKCKNTIFKKNF